MIRFTKWAIWLYIGLLFFEGALRKWILPGWSQPLLIVRDPVLFLIYGLALMSGIVPRTKFMIFLAALALASVCTAFLAGQNNLWVTLFGLRSNYLHVPLIWVMGQALNRKDVEKIGSFILIVAIPMTILMDLQYRAPIGSWINRGVGDDDLGQIYGANGHIRPPGFFTFITGPMVFFPLATAFFLYQISMVKHSLWRWLLVLLPSGIAIVWAMPASISRGTAIASGLVLAVFLVCLIWLICSGKSHTIERLQLKVVGRLFFVSLVISGFLAFSPLFKDRINTFMDRWDTAAAESNGDAVGSLITRVTAAFSQPIDVIERTPTFGYGIGVGTNVGARLLAGSTGFLLAEDEWGRVIMELGPMLGIAFIVFRLCLVVYLGQIAWRALRQDTDLLPVLIYSAAAWVILMNQWGQATQLGFAVVGGGLLLASVNRVDVDVEDEEEDGDSEENEDDAEETEEAASPEISEHEARRRRMRGL